MSILNHIYVYSMCSSMRLSDTFENRIIIDQRNEDADIVGECMAFLHSLALGPPMDKNLSNLKQKLQLLEENYPPSKKPKKKQRFYTTEIVPFLRKIAPEGCYYGRHPSDESLFGYWPRSLLL